MNYKSFLVAAAISTEACAGPSMQRNAEPSQPDAAGVSQVYIDKSLEKGETYSWEYNGQFKRELIETHQWGINEEGDSFLLEDIIGTVRWDLRGRTEECVRLENMPWNLRWRALRKCDRKVGSPKPYCDELYRLNIPEEIARKILRNVMVLDPDKSDAEKDPLEE